MLEIMWLEILYIYTVESDDDILEQRSDPGNFFFIMADLNSGRSSILHVL